MGQWQGKNLVSRLIAWMDQHLTLMSNPFYLILMLCTVAVFKALSLFAHRYSTRLISIRVSRDLRQKYFEHIQSLPMSFYHKYHTGNLSSRVLTDATVVADSINACLINYFQTPFTIVTTLVVCLLSSWKLSLVIFLGIPFVVFPIAYLAGRVRRVTRQMLKNQERFSSVLIDYLSGVQTVKIFAMEDFSLSKYREQNDSMARFEEKTARYAFSSRPIIHTIATIFISGVIVYGLYVLHMSLAEVIFFCGLLILFYEPVKKFAEENALIQRGVAAAERMFEVLAVQPQIEDKEDAVQLSDCKGEIEFRDVWFRYEEEWILRGLSFTAKPGEMVALVGPTGAGKSTVAQLLPRLYEAERGQVLIDGRCVADYTQRSLRDSIGFVPQRPFFFLGTVAENISFGRDFGHDAIVHAAECAHALEFIEALPKKFDAELAEAGKNLSGGQQQRLAIARALVKQAPILVLDEATSALDAVSENRIKLALRDLRGKVTQLVIAHRLSTIEDADKIVYLEHGRKVAEGSREELIESCPEFRHMWNTLNNTEAAGIG
jgi:ABC-type multidrug transport system fused ATPase/permease subunit